MEKTKRSKKPNVGVFVMRGQMITKAHEEHIEHSIATYDQTIVALGSANLAPSTRNPFSGQTRKRILEEMYGDDIQVILLGDYPYNDQKWSMELQFKVEGLVGMHTEVNLIGYEKDATSFYLRIFPSWKLDLRPTSTDHPIDATTIRKRFFAGEKPSDLSDFISAPMISFLDSYKGSKSYEWILNEEAAEQHNRDIWKTAPYPPTFNTVDAVVIQSGQILLIERKNFPGQGLMALPGGYVDPNNGNHLVDEMIRELREETGLKVPFQVLKGSIKGERTFGHPKRSNRGRIITQAFYIELRGDCPLPKVKGKDDAAWAGFVPLARLRGNTLFEDHGAIIQEMTGISFW